MAIKRHYEQVHPMSRAEWRAWLDGNHASSPGIWLVSYRSVTGRPRLRYDDIVEEALCFGWIDSSTRMLDPERSVLLITPRKPGSQWSAVNKRRIEHLEAAGLLHAAGQARIDAAKRDGSWTLLDDVEALVIPADLDAALARAPEAAAGFAAAPPSTRKQLLWRLQSAKRPETRARRIEEIVAGAIERAAGGR